MLIFLLCGYSLVVGTLPLRQFHGQSGFLPLEGGFSRLHDRYPTLLWIECQRQLTQEPPGRRPEYTVGLNSLLVCGNRSDKSAIGPVTSSRPLTRVTRRWLLGNLD